MLLVLVVLVAACTSAAPTTTATTTPAPPTTIVTDNGRTVEMVECADIPSDIAFVCEAYQLILDRFVDGVDEAELAMSASEGLAELAGNHTDTLVCPLLSAHFDDPCELAGNNGLDTATTAEALLSNLIGLTLDPNSAYYNPDTHARILEGESPSFAGIGALVRAEDPNIEGDNKQCTVISLTCQLRIVSTLEEHPARAAGVLADDVVIEVDGVDVIGWTVDEVVSAVRGPEGEPVHLLLDRDGLQVEITVVRALIRVPVVAHEVVGDTGYVRLYDFIRPDAATQFEEAVVALLAEGVERLVFDLRYNGGGLLSNAVAVASVFIPDGQVVVIDSPTEPETHSVNGRSVVPDGMEVMVLVNRSSASASEVVAGVLQERGIARIYGENTFGKNTVQQRWTLSNGGALRLTTARWLTPGGLDFGGVGLTPDVDLVLEEDLTPADVVAAILAAG